VHAAPFNQTNEINIFAALCRFIMIFLQSFTELSI
jgi:hypothetical protein